MRERGMSLLEVLVANTLLAVVTISGLALWDDASRLLAGLAREPDAALVQLALARLRADVHRANELRAAAGAWRSGPLELGGVDGDVVAYGVTGGALIRTEGGRPRRVLAQVGAWRWRVLGPRLVEVELGPPRRSAGPHPPFPAPGAVRVRFALRGGGAAW